MKSLLYTLFFFDILLMIASVISLQKHPGNRPAFIGLLTSVAGAVVLLLIACALSIR